MTRKTLSPRNRRRLAAARRSWTVRFQAAIPAVAALAVALQEHMPLIGTVLSGYWLVGVAVTTTAVGILLRVRSVE